MPIGVGALTVQIYDISGDKKICLTAGHDIAGCAQEYDGTELIFF